ncbi:MAG: DUF3899 domain-containing protein [Bacillota bacterium]|nr:DUF3899 domain-containing protein [Bacillota bacterium]
MSAFKKHLITLLAGLLIALPVFIKDGLFRADTAQRFYKALSNGCFLAAVLLLGVGFLTLVSNTGFFNAFRYNLYSIFRGMTKKGRSAPKVAFYEFNQEKRRRKGRFSHLMVIGSLFFLVALGATLLFETV